LLWELRDVLRMKSGLASGSLSTPDVECMLELRQSAVQSQNTTQYQNDELVLIGQRYIRACIYVEATNPIHFVSVASLGLVSPGAATNGYGVTVFFL